MRYQPQRKDSANTFTYLKIIISLLGILTTQFTHANTDLSLAKRFDKPSNYDSMYYILKGLAKNNAQAQAGYYLAKAAQESAFVRDARAGTSSAKGIFQFIDSTWKTELGKFAKKRLNEGREIMDDNNAFGQQAVDAANRNGSQSSMIRDFVDTYSKGNLRYHRVLQTELAHQYSEANIPAIKRILGKDPGNAGRYATHFLGPTGAKNFYTALKAAPNAKASTVNPSAARANKSIYYDRSGRAKTVQEVQNFFERKVGGQAKAFEEVFLNPKSKELERKSAAMVRDLAKFGYDEIADFSPTRNRSNTSLMAQPNEKNQPTPLDDLPKWDTHIAQHEHKPSAGLFPQIDTDTKPSHEPTKPLRAKPDPKKLTPSVNNLSAQTEEEDKIIDDTPKFSTKVKEGKKKDQLKFVFKVKGMNGETFANMVKDVTAKLKPLIDQITVTLATVKPIMNQAF